MIIETKTGNFLNFQFTQNSNLDGKNLSSKQIQSYEGKISEEVLKIQNQIKYPLYAIEEKLESTCSWEIEIQSKKVFKIKNLKSCSHPSFEEEFMNVIRTWNFELEDGLKFTIPVRYSLGK